MYHTDQDSLGLDLTPFVTAAQTGVDAYAKVKAADAALAAAKRGPAPVISTPGAVRKMNPLAYVMLAGGAVGIFFLVRRMLGRRGRR